MSVSDSSAEAQAPSSAVWFEVSDPIVSSAPAGIVAHSGGTILFAGWWR
jgi:hypothetical protein